MKPEFSAETLKEFNEIASRYPVKKAAMLPALHLAQREFGWISKAVMEYLGELLEVPYSEVYDTTTFYTMYKLKPMGKYHLQVCRTLSCALRGAPGLCQHIREKYGIDNGEVTGDGKFSFVQVECLGACGTAPVVQINDDYHENLSIQKFEEILENLR
jgi:NADH-quinone oxidoreductase E subunit